MKVSVKSKVRLNGKGIAGAILFVGGPTFAMINYGTMIRTMGSLTAIRPETYSLILAASALASLVGFVMMLVGREYDHTVDIDR